MPVRRARPGTLDGGLRGVDRGLRGAVRPAAAPDPARAGGPVRGLAGPHRRRLPGRARADGGPRPRRRHRVPAHRRHAGRAEGPPAAAGPRGRRSRRGAGPVGGARPAARPPPRVQDVQGRGPRAAAGCPTTPPARSPRAGPEERFAASQPDLLEGVSPARPARAAFARRSPRSPSPCRPHHVAPIRLTVAEAVAELVDELPRLGRITFRR